MTYQFDIDPRALIDARTLPWAAAGVPIEEIRKARDSITSMWGPGHGSWPEAWAPGMIWTSVPRRPRKQLVSSAGTRMSASPLELVTVLVGSNPTPSAFLFGNIL